MSIPSARELEIERLLRAQREMEIVVRPAGERPAGGG